MAIVIYTDQLDLSLDWILYCGIKNLKYEVVVCVRGSLYMCWLLDYYARHRLDTDEEVRWGRVHYYYNHQ
jgi:hypothetical protein